MESLPFSASKALCETHASSFSLAAQFLPEEKRNASYALYGFCRATDQLVDGKGTLKEKNETLNQWKSALEKEWTTKDSTHPLLGAFVSTCTTYFIPREWGFRLIEGLRKDLTKKDYETFDELYGYCFSAAAIPGILMAYVMGAKENAMEYAISLGIGMQLTNILRDAKEDFEMGRVYLPQEEMRQFGYFQGDLKNHTQNNAFHEMMKFNIARARDYYTHAEKGIEMLDEDARLGMRLCLVFYREILSEIERANYDVFSSRVFVSEKTKKEILKEQLADVAVARTFK